MIVLRSRCPQWHLCDSKSWPTPRSRTTIRWLLHWGSPLPIPNREVKPNSADGTATGGRVCRRLLRTPSLLWRGFLFLFHFSSSRSQKDIEILNTIDCCLYRDCQQSHLFRTPDCLQQISHCRLDEQILLFCNGLDHCQKVLFHMGWKTVVCLATLQRRLHHQIQVVVLKQKTTEGNYDSKHCLRLYAKITQFRSVYFINRC